MSLRLALIAACAIVTLAACSSAPTQPAQNVPLLSRNVTAIQSALAGTLGEPAIVEFYTTDCESCRSIRAEVGFLDQQYDGRIKFIYLDSDLPESQSFLGQFNVRGMPTFALLDRIGRVVLNIPGWPGDAAIKRALDALAVQ